ncbi:hypothetical protein BLNAU_13608 [Blattamonas nauphoetae]|uniref:Uncharacterized protein n=1 Tax=Blattamonas nauphoetae TaxID=2049346 RepID=A0ABQ9XHG3_9EUKA|nr:hypothetical protein BLNAU_13608 [Blattamonas nauphoetae]
MPLHHHHNSVLNHPGLSLHSDRTRRDPREHRFFHRNLSLNTISSQHYKIVRPILPPTPHHPNLITISIKSHNLETLVQTESPCPPQTNNQTPPFSHLSTSNKSTAFARPPRPPQDLRDRINPPPNSSPRRTSMEREEECPHSPPKEGIVTQKEKDTKSGLAKMFGWLTGWGKNTKPKSKSAEIKQTAKKKEKEDKDDKIGKSKPKEPEERSETTGTSDTPKPLIEPGEVQNKSRPAVRLTQVRKEEEDPTETKKEKEERTGSVKRDTTHQHSFTIHHLEVGNIHPSKKITIRKLPKRKSKQDNTKVDCNKEKRKERMQKRETNEWGETERKEEGEEDEVRAEKRRRQVENLKRIILKRESKEEDPTGGEQRNPQLSNLRQPKIDSFFLKKEPRFEEPEDIQESPPHTPKFFLTNSTTFQTNIEQNFFFNQPVYYQSSFNQAMEEGMLIDELASFEEEMKSRGQREAHEGQGENGAGGEGKGEAHEGQGENGTGGEGKGEAHEGQGENGAGGEGKGEAHEGQGENGAGGEGKGEAHEGQGENGAGGEGKGEAHEGQGENGAGGEGKGEAHEGREWSRRRRKGEAHEGQGENGAGGEGKGEAHEGQGENGAGGEGKGEAHEGQGENGAGGEGKGEAHEGQGENGTGGEGKGEAHEGQGEKGAGGEEREKHTKDRERMEQEEKEREKHTKDRERMEQEDREVHQKGEEEIQKETGEWLNELEASLRERMPRLKGKPTKETPRITETERVGKKQKDVDKSEREKGTLRKLLEEQEEVKRRKKIQEEERTAEKKRREREKMEVREEKTMIVDRRTGGQRDHNEERNPTEVPKRRNEEDMEELRSPNTILRENREDEVLETTISKLIDMNKLLKNENLNNLLRSLDIAEEGKQRRVYRWGTEKREKVKALGETLTVDILPIIGLLQYNTSEVNKKKLGELKQSDIEEIKNTTVPREPFTFVASKAWEEITQTKKKEKTTQRNQKPKKEHERRTDESRREKESRFQTAIETFEPGRGQSLPNTLLIPIPSFRRPAQPFQANTNILDPFQIEKGYTTWNEDLTNQHIQKAETLFLHHFATINEKLRKEEWSEEEVNRIAWGMSNIPHELKGQKKRKRGDRRERKSQNGREQSGKA